MKKTMNIITIIAFVLSVIFGIFYHIFNTGVWLSLAITFITTAYHFLMRLVVGWSFDKVMKNKADYNKKWFQVRAWEIKFYQKLGVKKWKNKMPTYAPELFSTEKHTWSEIAQAMCQAELVHETIVVLSFLPIFMTIFWGSLWVFIITSICAGLFDLSFVIMQRYNRWRVLKLIKKER